MISERLGFLFLHIPKTGGNAIQNVLKEWCDDEVIVREESDDVLDRMEVVNKKYGTWKHSTLEEYEAALNAELFGKLFKFSVLRNPWDRMISFYFSPHRGIDVKWERGEFEEMVMGIWPARRHLVLSDGGRLDKDINYLLRFEELQKGFSVVCERLGIGERKLPLCNVSKHKHYAEYYDAELRDLVGKMFAEEIEFGGYKFGE